MIKAAIFDMFETLITLFESPVYFGPQIAADAGIPEDRFLALWTSTEHDRTIGKFTLEQALENIFKECDCYSGELVKTIAEKRKESKKECFNHLHPEIIPMLKKIKKRGAYIGVISNCFSEEADVIRKSVLFPYFDNVYLSYEQGVGKPDEEIFRRCMRAFSVNPEECLYVGDGGCLELETASKLGMKTIQAAWYLKEGTLQPVQRKSGFIHAEKPLDVLCFL